MIKAHTPAYPECPVPCLTESSERKLLSGLILPNTVPQELCPRLRTPHPTLGGQALDPSLAPPPNVTSLRHMPGCVEQRMTGYNLGGASALGVYRGNPACGVLFNTQ